MGRQAKKTSATDLLSFRFSSSPPVQADLMSQGQQRQRTSRPRPGQQNRYRRSEEDRSSARRKAASSMFYLHSSADHAFVITRRAKREGYTFEGSDVAVPWEAVRSVRYLVPSTERGCQTMCPICLDSFKCARITKCGHCFCLPCLLRHVHSHTGLQKSQAVKCPCCSLPIHSDDFRPVTLESVLSPRVQSKIKLVKLHRNKDCPAPYLPQLQSFMHSSPHTAPVVSDRDASYCRFNYVDPALLQLQLAENQNELELELADMQKQPGLQHSSVETEMIVLQMALENVKHDRSCAQAEREEEEALALRFSGSNTGMYQVFPKSMFPPDWSTRAGVDIDTAIRDRSCSVDSGNVSVESDHGRQRGGSIGYGNESQGSKRRERQMPTLQSTMYLAEGATQFYQSADGQLCYLSKFNMSCLLSEFSVHFPEDIERVESMTPAQLRKLQPLPDELQGTILEIETVHLTPALRKRMPFLSHLPAYTDISFVEIDLNAILGDTTKKKFKAEFDKRRRRRKNKLSTEKKADRLARKQEERRIEELKLRIQRIDPSDDFFQPPAQPVSLTGDEFGPTLTSSASESRVIPDEIAQSSPSPANPTLSFSAVTGRGFSVLNPAGIAEDEAFPSLMSTQQPDQSSTTKRPAASFNHSAAPRHPPTGKGKSKSKGKKVVLFSTGGHRGAGL